MLTAQRSALHRLKTSNEQLDDRIVEVHWDSVGEHWRMMRFRSDKPNGNHKSVVDNIIKSIADGIEKDVVSRFSLPSPAPYHVVPITLTPARAPPQLLARSQTIRANWKARQGQPTGSAPPQPKTHALPPKPVQTLPPPPVVHALPPKPPQLASVPRVEPRYGPLAPSRWSKVTGPEMVAGMYR